MEKKKKKVSMVVILLVVVVLVGALMVIPNKNSSDSNQEPIENVTDMDTLKSSEYTSDKFEQVNLGDSKKDVQSKMGKLEEVDTESDSDIYSATDNQTVYYFYFTNDKLENVSVFLAE